MSTVDNNHTAISRDAPATIAPEPQDVVAADRKAPEKLILDSKEKIEYYRTIMQELDFWRRFGSAGKRYNFFYNGKAFGGVSKAPGKPNFGRHLSKRRKKGL
ncbi:uncharacterized protein LOC144548916 isoform X4 [Carex rostrata]